MVRKDYPWHPSDIKRVNSLLGTLFKFIVLGTLYLVWGIFALIKLIGSKITTSVPDKKNNTLSLSENRRWLVLINDADCNYERAFAEHGYVYVNSKNRHINVGDTVYLYNAREKRVKYDTTVVDIGVKRQDNDYWNVPPPKGATCKLEMMGEYKGKALSLSKLKKNGFNGEKTIKLPICNNMELLDYIEDEFDNMYYCS